MNSSAPDPYGVEKFMVEKSRFEMSCKLLESGHFNPGLLNPRLFNHEFFNPIVVLGWGVHGCKGWGREVRGWNLGLKSPRLECPATIEVYKNKDNSINIYFKLSYLTYVLIAIWSDITNALQKIFYHIGWQNLSRYFWYPLIWKKHWKYCLPTTYLWVAFYRSKIILVGPICFGQIQFVLVWCKLFLTGPNYKS